MTRKQKYFKVAGYKYLAKSSPFDSFVCECSSVKTRTHYEVIVMWHNIYYFLHLFLSKVIVSFPEAIHKNKYVILPNRTAITVCI